MGWVPDESMSDAFPACRLHAPADLLPLCGIRDGFKKAAVHAPPHFGSMVGQPLPCSGRTEQLTSSTSASYTPCRFSRWGSPGFRGRYMVFPSSSSVTIT